MDYEAIAKEAFEAAANASAEMLAKCGDGFPCGFAWVIVPDGRSPMAKVLKKYDARKAYGTRGVQVWNPGKSYAQNVDILSAGANAFVEVLKKHGIDCYCDSRLD